MAKLGQGIRKKLHTRRVQIGGKFHNTSARGRKIETLKVLEQEEDPSLLSVWETKNVDEFFVNCLKDQDAFLSEKSQASIVDFKEKRTRIAEVYDYDDVPIPRRPSWTKRTSRRELERNEEASFLDWRRNLARTEQVSAKVITPYEKNLEVWRQLWRVLERSNLVVQIVDARNPLLFRSIDLERYVKEVGATKTSFILINKADMLSEQQRRLWADHFRRAGVKFAFFSALLEQVRINMQSKSKRERLGHDALKSDAQKSEFPSDLVSTEAVPAPSSEDVQDAPEPEERKNEFNVLQQDDEDEHDSEMHAQNSPAKETSSSSPSESSQAPKDIEKESADAAIDEQSESKEAEAQHASEHSSPTEVTQEVSSFSDAHSTIRVLSCAELLSCFHRVYKEFAESQVTDPADKSEKMPAAGRLVVGMVGYPNVGKSATINALFGEKKVAVASTPGKTKHFQTLNLSDDLQVCDCPGLVFPQFMNSRADLVCSGILPIDRLRDWFSPVELVCDRVGEHIAEITAAFPGLILPENKTIIDGRTLLQCVATLHGWFGTGRVPSESRAARLVLKSYVAGSLLYCHAPPGLDADALDKFFESLAHSRKRLVDVVDDTDSDLASVSSSTGRKAERLDASMLSNDPALLDDHRKGNSKRKHGKKTRAERKQAARDKFREKALSKRAMPQDSRSSFKSSAVVLGNVSQHMGKSGKAMLL